VPFIAEGKISTEVSVSYEHTWGTEKYHENTYSTTVNCEAPKKKKVVCNYVTNAAKLNVPYKMHLTQLGGFTKTIEGTWKGVQTFNDHISFDESDSLNPELDESTLM